MSPSIESSCARLSSSVIRWYASASPRGGDDADDDGETIEGRRPRSGLGVLARGRRLGGLLGDFARPRESLCAGRIRGRYVVDLRPRDGEVEGRLFSSLASEVAWKEAANDRDPNFGRGFENVPGRVFSLVGLGIGMLEVFRLSVKKSGGCCDRIERRVVNKG